MRMADTLQSLMSDGAHVMTCAANPRLCSSSISYIAYSCMLTSTLLSGCRDVTNFGNSLGMSSYFNLLFPDALDNTFAADFVVAHCETTPGGTLL
jgi:hypothetical protein